MGLFFGLIQGDNDDSLQWPFANQVVRLQLEDQNPDVQIRMSQFSQFMTSDSDSKWDQPDGVNINVLIYILNLKYVRLGRVSFTLL